MGPQLEIWHILPKNPENELAQNQPSLLPSYSMKALHIADINMRDAVYATDPESQLQSHVFLPVNVARISTSFEAPVVISKVGKGRLDFVGDVNIESGSIILTMTMPRLLSPRPVPKSNLSKAGALLTTVDFNAVEGDEEDEDRVLPPRITDKFVAIIELMPPIPDFEDQFHQQIRGVAKRIQVNVAKSAKDALELFAAPNLHGVFVFDKGIANPSHVAVLNAQVQYVKNGGLAVFAGSFPVDSKMDTESLTTAFSAFGLPWTRGTLWGRDIQVNLTHATALASPSLPEEYSVTAHNLQGFHFEDMLYTGGSPTRLESPMLRARVGKGYVGYMGDTNPEAEHGDHSRHARASEPAKGACPR